MNKLILTDSDGVLTDWEWAFRVWMTEHGFEFNEAGKKSYYLTKHYDISENEVLKQVRMFNESAAIGFLPALRDSTHYVKRLHEEHGYQFRVITSLSMDKNAQKLRVMNLKKLFGDAIEQVIFLDTNAPKDQALLPYKDSGMYWLEDKPENADVGYTLGLKSMLVEHGFNMNHSCEYPIVKNWKEIYAIVTSSELV
jgi:hypothetical protein